MFLQNMYTHFCLYLIQLYQFLFRTWDMAEGLFLTMFCYTNKNLLTKQSAYKASPTMRGPIVLTTKATTSAFVMGFASILCGLEKHFPTEMPRMYFATDG